MSALVIGPAVTNNNASALVSLEFSKEMLNPALHVEALTQDMLKGMFEHARARSNEIFKQMKPSQQLTVKEIEDRANATTISGDLPDGIDALVGRIALETTATLASCVILVQTSYEAPWEFALCVVGNDSQSFYAVFDAKKGTFKRSTNLDATLKEYLTDKGIYYRAVFVKLEEPAAAAVATAVVVKKEKEEAEEKPTAIVEEKKKKLPAVRKRAAPTPAPAAAAEPEQKKPVLEEK
jgi:hypothetical protein